MRSLKKRGPHVLDDLNDLLFSLQISYPRSARGGKNVNVGCKTMFITGP